METIGAFDAKTHLSALLARVEQGEEFTITRHGKAVARLVPAVDRAAEASLRRARAVDGLLQLRERYSLRGVSIRELIDAGRKY